MKNYLLYSRVHPNSLESIVEVKATKYRQTNQLKFKKLLSRHVVQDVYTSIRVATGRKRQVKVYAIPHVSGVCEALSVLLFTAPLICWVGMNSGLHYTRASAGHSISSQHGEGKVHHRDGSQCLFDGSCTSVVP